MLSIRETAVIRLVDPIQSDRKTKQAEQKLNSLDHGEVNKKVSYVQISIFYYSDPNNLFYYTSIAHYK